MRLLISALYCLGALMIGALAQKLAPQPPNSVPKVRVERVEIGNTCAWCTSPSESKTIIAPTSIESVTVSLLNKGTNDRTHPKTKYRIAKQDWEDLERFIIDPKVLAAFTGAIGCPGCGDEPVEWVEVKFSDGTKKFVEYNQGEAPAPIVSLVNKVRAISPKPKPQQKPPSLP